MRIVENGKLMDENSDEDKNLDYPCDQDLWEI